MLEVLIYGITHERLHSHRIVTKHAYRARSRSRRFGGHDRTYKRTVIPVSRLIYKRSGGRSSAAEDDCGKRHARLGIEILGKARAVHSGSGETGIRMRRGMFAVCIRFGRPGVPLPVDKIRGGFFRKFFPPHRTVFRIVSNVREDRAFLRSGKRVRVGMFVRAGGNAEETVFGVCRPQSAVFAYADPGNIVAHRLDFIARVAIFFGRNKHCEVRFAASRRERRRDIFHFFILRTLASEDQHVLCHPAFVLAEVRGDTKREAFLAEKHVSAVCRVYGYDRIVFGEMHDISLFGIYVAFAVETFYEIAVFAELLIAINAHSRHDFHIQHNVDRIGDFDTDLRERRSHNAHRIGNNVHRSALHLALSNLFHQRIRFFRIHPFHDGMRHSVLFLSRTDERAVFHTRHVVFRRSVQIAIGQQLVVEFDHFSRCHRFGAEGVALRFAAVDPYDLIGLSEFRAFFHELQNFFVFRKIGFYFKHCGLSP